MSLFYARNSCTHQELVQAASRANCERALGVEREAKHLADHTVLALLTLFKSLKSLQEPMCVCMCVWYDTWRAKKRFEIQVVL